MYIPNDDTQNYPFLQITVSEWNIWMQKNVIISASIRDTQLNPGSTLNWVFVYQPIPSDTLTQSSRYKRAECNLLADEKVPTTGSRQLTGLYIYYLDKKLRLFMGKVTPPPSTLTIYLAHLTQQKTELFVIPLVMMRCRAEIRTCYLPNKERRVRVGLFKVLSYGFW